MTKIKNFNTVSYKFKLLDTTDRPVSGLPIVLQYYNATTKAWEIFHKNIIQNGGFSFTENINPPLPALPESIFLQDNLVPELRVVTSPAIYGYTKPEVLAPVCRIIIDESQNANTITFDFGARYLVEKDIVPVADIFPDFVVITSAISLVNQMNNIRLIQKLQADVAVRDQKIADQQVLLAANEQTINTLNTQLTNALSQLEQKTLAVTRLETIKQELENTIGDLQTQIDVLQQQIGTDTTPIPVNALYSNLVRELDTATRNTDSGYKLANISLKLKTLITRDEEGINAQLFDISQMDQINGNAVSEIVFDIAPATTTSTRSGTVPNLLGHTETAVRKILTSLGLKLNPVYQNNPQVVDGDSFKQSPAADTEINPNDFVTVIFSKHE